MMDSLQSIEWLEWANWLWVTVIVPAILASGWFARQSFIRRKIAKIVINAVTELMQEAQIAKEEHGGKIPGDIAESLQQAAVAMTETEITINKPELIKPMLNMDLNKTVDKAVETVKKRGVDFSRPGAKGGRR